MALGVRLDAGHQVLRFFGSVLTYTRIPPYVHPDYFTEEDEVVVGRVPFSYREDRQFPGWEFHPLDSTKVTDCTK